jgi:hypothetical protein
LKYELDHWRCQFRWHAQSKDDRDVTESDVAAHHLILWGDPSSNTILAKVIGKLPLQWITERVQLGDHSYDASHDVPVMIYPNPLNRKC